MNIFSYIDKYGEFTFDEVSFTEVDNAIMASLSYINFNNIVSNNRSNKITIGEASDKYFKMHKSKEKLFFAVKQAVKVLKYIKDTKRYKNLLLYNYVYNYSDEFQFSALTIEISSKLVYISFEGTDHLVSGWKEDFMMTYMFPIPSQKKAIDYLNKKFILSSKKIILGGHSKGGNLAMVAGMYANMLVRGKIIKIYNNDGPGVLEEQFKSLEYERIKDKLVNIIPNYSVVGILLYNDNQIVIRSLRKGLWAHDIHSWAVSDKAFMRADIDSYNDALGEEIKVWMSKYSNEERERFVIAMFDIFKKSNIDNFLELGDNFKVILELISNSKELSDVDKDVLKELFSVIFNCYKDAKLDGIKKILEKKDKVLKR